MYVFVFVFEVADVATAEELTLFELVSLRFCPDKMGVGTIGMVGANGKGTTECIVYGLDYGYVVVLVFVLVVVVVMK